MMGTETWLASEDARSRRATHSRGSATSWWQVLFDIIYEEIHTRSGITIRIALSCALDLPTSTTNVPATFPASTPTGPGHHSRWYGREGRARDHPARGGTVGQRMPTHPMQGLGRHPTGFLEQRTPELNRACDGSLTIYKGLAEIADSDVHLRRIGETELQQRILVGSYDKVFRDMRGRGCRFP
jgi:hypothetical protein